VHLFRPRRSRGSTTGEDKRHFLAEMHVKFTTKQKTSLENYKFILHLPFSSRKMYKYVGGNPFFFKFPYLDY
jgi:hypothetical protein